MHLFKENHGFSSVFFSASLNSTSSSSSSSSDVLGLGGASKGGRFLLLSPSSKPLLSPKSKLVDGSERSRKADSCHILSRILVRDDIAPKPKPHVAQSHFNKSSPRLRIENFPKSELSTGRLPHRKSSNLREHMKCEDSSMCKQCVKKQRQKASDACGNG